MTAKVLDGRALAQARSRELAGQVAAFTARHRVAPGLAAVLVGGDPASKMYVDSKARAAGRVGIRSETFHLAGDTTAGDYLALIDDLNRRDDVHGILPQLPLPPQIDPQAVFERIDPEKDVDGLSPANAGRLALGRPRLIPATPLGILVLIEHAGASVEGAEAVIVGRSNIVGRPTALLLLARNATVTICHSRTADLGAHTRRAGILVSAVGEPRLIRREMVRPGAVVIDVGNSHAGGKLVGDVDFEAVKEVAAAITPVPGGVGPMTIAMLLENTLAAARLQAEGRP
ncbi:MAG: bifunctional 5,10-methylenetetrahydrofolate dehydrogenase/5,10-methenyltetrahydrofolate cyclohydrolase [Bacillati bacterium ANGP1]|uniref:Bifunctional protein FolD n=1 Tax=Candidatus Segetimicrobium genomatis TaxID=2569760 RepID=A0A537K5K2_9BACT|nr:MAG: bifunctional 5,10-methylenetetrahydrofolate dehydrogenase/5,10-methenyltetrahydrofolate cyclohydrolase [Terrabacteria group bacterium ANGP1]